jgi:hypothetical protein
MPHSVVRIYTNSGPLVGLLREREDEVREIMTSVSGFLMYGLMETGDGGIVSLTVCEDRAGTDESVARAAEWIKANSPADVSVDPPRILQGEPVVRFRAENIPDRDAHVALRIFRAPAPPDLANHSDAIRELMTAVPGFRSYTAIATDGNGVSIISADDKAGTDTIGERMREFVTTAYPAEGAIPRAELIEGTSLFRFEAQPAPA